MYRHLLNADGWKSLNPPLDEIHLTITLQFESIRFTSYALNLQRRNHITIRFFCLSFNKTLPILTVSEHTGCYSRRGDQRRQHGWYYGRNITCLRAVIVYSNLLYCVSAPCKVCFFNPYTDSLNILLCRKCQPVGFLYITNLNHSSSFLISDTQDSSYTSGTNSVLE